MCLCMCVCVCEQVCVSCGLGPPLAAAHPLGGPLLLLRGRGVLPEAGPCGGGSLGGGDLAARLPDRLHLARDAGRAILVGDSRC